jgi:hypothetical protein
MGLDQMMFVVTNNVDNTDFEYSDDCDYLQISSWRKHPYMHGWMEQLYNRKADSQAYEGETDFNSNIAIHAKSADGEELSPEEIESELKSEKDMMKEIMQESFMAQANNIHKKRVFNRQCIRLNIGDLDQLEMAIKLGQLPKTEGFFFGEDSSKHYKEYDLRMIAIAKEAIKSGFDVYYDSWW